MNGIGCGNEAVTVKKYSNGVKDVETLRAEGWKVRVYHARCWGDYNGFIDTSTAISVKDMKSGPVQNCFGSTLKQDKISCWGGYTRVELTSPDGKSTSVGKYNFGNRQFNRKIGLQAAIGRAIKNMQVVRNCGA